MRETLDAVTIKLGYHDARGYGDTLDCLIQEGLVGQTMEGYCLSSRGRKFMRSLVDQPDV
ncbi:MAG TPA: hypothetical protein VLE72_03400 [Candidatus Saccharimonadales bacterium]|nr:hypothetical protein [Candidatus Saccharimonadales bacterium]